MYFRSFVLSIIIFGFGYLPAQAENLQKSIHKLINQHGLDKNNIGILVKSVSANNNLAVINHKKLFTPASTVKLATTYAALLEFGKDYRWPMEFYITGTLHNGIVNGNLIVKAYGNPDLITEDLDKIVSIISDLGIKTITGNFIIDRSYFNVSADNSDNFDHNPHNPYNAMADAMMFNHRASKIKITANKKTGNVEVARDLPDKSFVILNYLKPSNKSCRGHRAWPQISFTSYKNKPAIKFAGVYSLRCQPREIYRVITKPYYMFYYGLKHKLSQNNIHINGALNISKVPSNARKIFVLKSRPLLEIIAKINKKSNNVMARQVLLSLGAKIYGPGADYKNGIDAVNQILQKQQVITKPLNMQNGSGLSRTAKLSTQNLADILKHSFSKFGANWLQSLAVMAEDGTLKKRLSALKGQAWMKTGGLKHVRTIAGYVRAKSGKMYIVVMLQNGKHSKHKGGLLQNDIIKLVHATL